MEKVKINKSCWIGNIVCCCVGVMLMIVEGILGHFTSIYSVTMVCYSWASVFYFCQYFIAKRPKGVLIGAVLYSLAFVLMLVVYILYTVGVI